MSISMYKASVPVIGQMLGSLDAILDKAFAHCEANKIAPECCWAIASRPILDH